MYRPAREGGLDQPSISILMACLEARIPRLSAAAIGRHPGAGEALKKAGLLRSGGHERVITSASELSDVPVMAVWSPEHQSYGYFSVTEGWISLSPQHLEYWTVDLAIFFSTLTSDLHFPNRQAALTLVPDHLWELGSIHLGKRPKRTPILFGRRLRIPQIWQEAKTVLRNRPSTQHRVLLTSTRSPLINEPLASCAVISIEDVLRPAEGLAIDSAALAARLNEVPELDQQNPIRLIAGGREVRFLGQTFKFTKAVRQREVVRYIYDRYLAGERWTSCQEILEELEFGPGTRIRDIFKDSPAWKHLLTEKSGMCGFCFEDEAITARS